MIQENPTDFLYHKKLTTFERGTARGSEVVALQPARARSVCESTHYFNFLCIMMIVEREVDLWVLVSLAELTALLQYL